MRGVTIEQAKSIMTNHFIGPEELSHISAMKLDVPKIIPEIPFPVQELMQKKHDYLLILGVSRFTNGMKVNIRNLMSVFGRDPDKGEPCFYNQDWYDKEDFIDISIKDGWYLIRCNVYEDSRAVLPHELIKKYTFPNAISCVYAFFVTWLALDIKLWYHDFVWCSDTDHNKDRIYVGKYHDVDGVNKNGFSIHRHLALRSCYGCVD